MAAAMLILAIAPLLRLVNCSGRVTSALEVGSVDDDEAGVVTEF